MRTGKLWAAFRPYLWITLASAVFALGFDWCYVPNQITLGGMTGLGQIIHAIVPAIPVGSAVIALNLPLFLLGWRLLGWKLLASSLFAKDPIYTRSNMNCLSLIMASWTSGVMRISGWSMLMLISSRINRLSLSFTLCPRISQQSLGSSSSRIICPRMASSVS